MADSQNEKYIVYPEAGHVAAHIHYKLDFETVSVIPSDMWIRQTLVDYFS